MNGLLVWPLFVAGLCAVASTHQCIIIGRFRTIYKTCRTDIMIRSMEFLRDRWKVYPGLEGASGTRGGCPDVSLAWHFCLQDPRLPAILVYSSGPSLSLNFIAASRHYEMPTDGPTTTRPKY